MTTAVPATEIETSADPSERPDAERWWSRENNQLLVALGAALALHLLPVLFIVGRWIIVGDVDGEVDLGDPAGLKGGVNVEVVDAEEFNRRYISFSKGKEIADSEAAKTSPQQPQPQQQPAPQQPQEPQQRQEQAEQSAKQPDEPPPTEEATPGPSTPSPETAMTSPPQPTAPPTAKPSSPSPQLTEADIAQILEDARLELEGVVQMTSAAGAARQGRVSEYVRGVLRRLKETMPKSKGIRGSVVVGIILADNGEVGLVGVLRSSGHPELDRTVVERIRTTRFSPPPPNTSMQERRFQVTYDYH